MMYIYIWKDGAILKSEKIGKDDLKLVENGILSIIDISDPENPKDYIEDEWEPLFTQQL